MLHPGLGAPHYMESEGVEIECGDNVAVLYRSKFGARRSASKRCICFNSDFYSPREFERKCQLSHQNDWKTSVKYKGETIQTLISDGRLPLHDRACKCDWCSLTVDINRKRKTPIDTDESDSDEDDSIYVDIMGNDEEYTPRRAVDLKPKRILRKTIRPKRQVVRWLIESSSSSECKYNSRKLMTQLDLLYTF
jgi:hypothetical protein